MDALISERPPVVLIHGWSGSTRTTWMPLGWPEALEREGRRVIAIDLLGHGESEAPTSTEAYASLVDNALEQFEHEPVVDSVAFSLGAKVLLELVARQPERFRRIVLAGVGENVLRGEPARTGVADSLRHGISEATPAAVRPYVVHAFASGNDPHALAACIERPWIPMDPARLVAFSGPVLLAVGDDDTFIGSPDSLLKAFADARLVRLAGVDHLGTPYAPTLQITALEFLRG